MAPARKEPAPKPSPAANMQSASSGEVSANATESEPESYPEPQKPFRMSDLDLDVSYVGVFELSPHEPRPRWPEIWHESGTPYPRGWSATDLNQDLSKHEARIERYRKQMVENNMPEHAREKLAHYEKQLADKMELKARYPGLKWQTLLQIEELERAKQRFALERDRGNIVPSLEAIITAYESRQLDVYPDERLVTYWHKGKQISQPRPFNWEEYHIIAAGCEGRVMSVWVEPIGVPQQRTNNIYTVLNVPRASNLDQG
ncbi:uncharacterized protein N7496_010526 [Penicillium cataractarum]|uniref:Uncharacterized protein n=1 Tax=Penicillium cataractarum TaxID=2100454 RepID=A0A9W9RVY9_9EURO|nr:uncharacterized protein N7496_010526 [Penicillium cataractarum]KAJ5364813.1 hypothetical protein N7496_010526 [Penicillium cataractarum]